MIWDGNNWKVTFNTSLGYFTVWEKKNWKHYFFQLSGWHPDILQQSSGTQPPCLTGTPETSRKVLCLFCKLLGLHWFLPSFHFGVLLDIDAPYLVHISVKPWTPEVDTSSRDTSPQFYISEQTLSLRHNLSQETTSLIVSLRWPSIHRVDAYLLVHVQPWKWSHLVPSEAAYLTAHCGCWHILHPWKASHRPPAWMLHL